MEPEVEETAAAKFEKEHGLYWHEDMLLPKHVSPSLLERVRAFNFDKNDVLISTYPRSGTTWSQELTWLVSNNADVETATKVDRHERSRFIEFHHGHIRKPEIEHLEATPPPRIIKTHFTPQYFEVKREEVGFKTIIVMRNLKDVLVSTFHFYKNLFKFTGTWEDFFEMFKQGKMLYGSWANHCLKCWQLRDDPNVLILKYEDMKKDSSASIGKIAQFCGKVLNDEQVSLIADFADFSKMKERVPTSEKEKKGPKNEKFFRKGVIGDWQALFTEEQLEYVHEILKTTTEKEGLFFDDN